MGTECEREYKYILGLLTKYLAFHMQSQVYNIFFNGLLDAKLLFYLLPNEANNFS